jgi:hypothetical protein
LSGLHKFHSKEIVVPGKIIKLIVAFATATLAFSASAEGGHEKHHHHFAKDVDALHSVLAPLWHAKPGKARSQKVCAQAGQLGSLSRDIRSGDNAALLTSITALKAQCQKAPADINDIDAVFSQVHDAFHRLVDPA